MVSLCVTCFFAGYGAALLLAEDAKQSDLSLEAEAKAEKLDSDLMTSRSPSTKDNAAKERELSHEEVPAVSYSAEQRSILDSIKEKFVGEAIELLVDSVDVDDLVPLVARISGYDEDTLWNMEQPHNFAKELLNLNLKECSAQEAGDELETELEAEELATSDSSFAEDATEVFFSLKSINDFKNDSGVRITTSRYLAPVYIKEFQQANASRIYASFQLPYDYAYQDILVKWCQETPQQRNIVFGPHSINSGRKLNYVWYEAAKAEIGDYQVQIYSSDEQPRMLAKGVYSIIANPE
ncbi:MAG: hypothetical protein HAW61_03040 [Candidatus Portiera sp.]|nr:hypothetical protein [Portiera sp.]